MDAQRQHLIDAVRAAAADGRTLRLRGGGTKDFWGASLQGEVLDTRGYAGILSYEPSELVVTARCGTPLAELEAALAAQGQCLAFEPPHFGPGATVGGMVAAGLSGPARASVGAVRDFVLGIRMVNGKGEDLTFGGQVMKNVAGYDVSRLLAGSWGTLGIVTEVSLKVLPVAPAEVTLMCAGIGQQDALNLLHRWGGQPLPLNASAWVHDTTADPGDDYLFVRLRGAVAAVQSALGRMSADAAALGAKVQVMDQAEAAQDWRASGEQTLQFFEPPSAGLCLWRLSVPQTAPVLELPYPQYIEWQGAQRWLWAPVTAGAQLREAAQCVGGHALLFRHSLDRHASLAMTGEKKLASTGEKQLTMTGEQKLAMTGEKKLAMTVEKQLAMTDEQSVAITHEQSLREPQSRDASLQGPQSRGASLREPQFRGASLRGPQARGNPGAEEDAFMPMSAVQLRIQRALQKQFDPQGVFATGRMGF